MDIQAHMDMHPATGSRGILPSPLAPNQLIRRCRSVPTLPEVYYRIQDLLDEPTHDRVLLTRYFQSGCWLILRVLHAANS